MKYNVRKALSGLSKDRKETEGNWLKLPSWFGAWVWTFGYFFWEIVFSSVLRVHTQTFPPLCAHKLQWQGTRILPDWKGIWQNILRAMKGLCFDTGISLLEIALKEVIRQRDKALCAMICVAVLSVLEKIWKLPKSPILGKHGISSTDRWTAL